MQTMKKKQKQPDLHRSGWMIRLPEIYREQLRTLFQQMRRPMTTEVQIALEKHLAEFGLWPPKEPSE
jgi:hypothetical protein